MADLTAIQRDLRLLEAELKRLETEYTLYFGNRVARPPLKIRQRVEVLLKRWDNTRITSSADRFLFNTLQARYATFADLWDRAMRAREEGRSGPFARQPPQEPAAAREKPAAGPVTLSDPARETAKVQALYETLVEAREQAGEAPLPYEQFLQIVRTEVKKVRARGDTGASFRVAVRQGKVSFTVQPVKKEPQ